MIKVTVWNEFIHENVNEHVRSIYPEGIHNEIAKFLIKTKHTGKNRYIERA